MNLFLDELPRASPAAGIPADGGHDGIPTVVQLPKLVAGCLPGFGKAAHGLRDGDESLVHTRFDRIGRVDVLDVGGRELQELVGIPIHHPQLVDAAHDLHVLLRHRASISLIASKRCPSPALRR